MTDTKYLQKRKNNWYVVVEVPKALRKASGAEVPPRFLKSLKTASLPEANRLKYLYVAAFQERINSFRCKHDPKAERFRLAVDNARTLAALADSVAEGHGGEVNWRDWIRTIIEREGIEEGEGAKEASRYKASTGQGTRIRDHIAPWIAESPDTGQTKAQHKATLNRYLAWAGEFVTIEQTDRVKAGEYVTQLLTASGLARRTIKRHLSSLSNFWLWLDSKGQHCTNVWLGHRLGKKKGAVRTALSDQKVLKVLNGTYRTKKYGPMLRDLSRLALLHGARLDELCSLRKADVHKREDGYWMVVGDGKTESAIREIPAHGLAVRILERRLKGVGEWLFEGLMPGGPDEKRSWYVSKAYGRFRKQIGIDAPYEDFRALRNTFIECMEGEEVAESTVKLIVGHKRASMTYGHYSKGQRVSLRAAIDKLDYGSVVMVAF